MNKSIGVCLIGAGRAGMIHAMNFAGKTPGAHMAAVVDIDPLAAKDAASRLNIDKFHTDYTRILEDDAVDAVVIVSPTNLHKQIVIDCAKAKKHVFCEKPMAMNANECSAMIAACEENGVKLQIGFMRRHDESFQEAKRLLDEGAIGELVQIHSCTRGPSKPRPWMYDLKKSNGILAEVNSHDIDSVRWFSGSEYKSLYAIGGNYRNREVAEQYPDYYDSVLMNGEMRSGVQFSIDGAAYIQYGYDSRVELVGAKGAIRVGRQSRDFTTCVTVENGVSSAFIRSWTDLFRDAYLGEDIGFIESIRNDTTPLVTGLDGLRAVEAVYAGNESIAAGTIVHL